MRDLLIAKIVGNTEGVMDLSEEESNAIQSLAENTNEEHLALLLSELIKAEPSIRSALFPRISLEMTLLRLSMMSHFVTVDDAIKMLGGAVTKSTSVQAVQPVRDNVPKKSAVKEPQIKRPLSNEIIKPAISAEKKSGEIPAAAVITAAEVASPPKAVSDADLWETVLERLEDSNAPLVSKLRQGSASVSKEGINILFNGGTGVLGSESVKANLALIQDTIKSVAGKTLPVRVETKEVKSISKADLKEKALANPVVREALELFEGRIADISQINDK